MSGVDCVTSSTPKLNTASVRPCHHRCLLEHGLSDISQTKRPVAIGPLSLSAAPLSSVDTALDESRAVLEEAPPIGPNAFGVDVRSLHLDDLSTHAPLQGTHFEVLQPDLPMTSGMPDSSLRAPYLVGSPMDIPLRDTDFEASQPYLLAISIKPDSVLRAPYLEGLSVDLPSRGAIVEAQQTNLRTMSIAPGSDAGAPILANFPANIPTELIPWDMSFSNATTASRTSEFLNEGTDATGSVDIHFRDLRIAPDPSLPTIPETSGPDLRAPYFSTCS